MELIDIKVNLNDYKSLTIVDKNFDDTTNENISINVSFLIEETDIGINVDVREIKAVTWSYTGIKWQEYTDIETEITGESDSTYKIAIYKSKSRNDSFGISLESAYINMQTKEIRVEFE